MRALWPDRQNCSHNVFQKVKCIRRFSDFLNKYLGEFCGGFFGVDILEPFFLGKKPGGKNPPKNPQQNSNQNWGVSRPKSALQGSGLDPLTLMGSFRAPRHGGKTAPLKRPIKRTMIPDTHGHARAVKFRGLCLSDLKERWCSERCSKGGSLRGCWETSVRGISVTNFSIPRALS